MNFHMKGNTLVEILVSLSVISLMFVLGSMIFQSLSGIHSPVQQFYDRSIVREVLYRSLPEVIEGSEEWEIRGRRVVRSILPLKTEKDILEIKVSCFWQDKLMLERSRYTEKP